MARHLDQKDHSGLNQETRFDIIKDKISLVPPREIGSNFIARGRRKSGPKRSAHATLFFLHKNR
jgi:hypothetical protein